MRGYKAFDKDLKCRGKQYAVGGEYEEDGKPVICAHGMHFCEQLTDVFDYYPFDEDETRVCEIEALGDVAREGDDSSKCCTNRIKVIRELDWNEILKLANNGTANTGYHNSGDWNSGDHNTGHHNSGDYNSGHCNSGYWNSGDWNSGRRNSGDWNSGDFNSGDFNSGDFNNGSDNSGRYNIGNRNSGDWNATDFSSGVLCTEVPECLIFDKPSGMTLAEWRKSHASRLLERVPIDASKWVDAIEMTDEEKAAHPEWEVTGGYLRKGTYKRDFTSWWAGLDNDEKAEIFTIPNFAPDKFEKITGLHLHDEMPEQEKHEEKLREIGAAMAELLAGLDAADVKLVFDMATRRLA